LIFVNVVGKMFMEHAETGIVGGAVITNKIGTGVEPSPKLMEPWCIPTLAFALKVALIVLFVKGPNELESRVKSPPDELTETEAFVGLLQRVIEEEGIPCWKDVARLVGLHVTALITLIKNTPKSIAVNTRPPFAIDNLNVWAF